MRNHEAPFNGEFNPEEEIAEAAALAVANIVMKDMANKHELFLGEDVWVIPYPDLVLARTEVASMAIGLDNLQTTSPDTAKVAKDLIYDDLASAELPASVFDDRSDVDYKELAVSTDGFTKLLAEDYKRYLNGRDSTSVFDSEEL